MADSRSWVGTILVEPGFLLMLESKEANINYYGHIKKPQESTLKGLPLA